MRADSTGTGIGTIVMPASTFLTRVDWTASTGTVKVYYNPTVFGTQDNFTTGNGRFVLASSSQITQYMLVNTPANLQAIGTNGTTLAQNYALGPADLNMTGFPFLPLGIIGGGFTGKFDGLGHTISNLTIALNDTTTQSTGMFSLIAAGGRQQPQLRERQCQRERGLRFEHQFAMGRRRRRLECRNHQQRHGDRDGQRLQYPRRHRRRAGRPERNARPGAVIPER